MTVCLRACTAGPELGGLGAQGRAGAPGKRTLHGSASTTRRLPQLQLYECKIHARQRSWRPRQAVRAVPSLLACSLLQALVVPSVGYSYWDGAAASSWLGAMVADRLMARPGDALHLAAWLQQRVGSRLQPPASAPSVSLEVSPAWGDAATNGPLVSGGLVGPSGPGDA